LASIYRGPLQAVHVGIPFIFGGVGSEVMAKITLELRSVFGEGVSNNLVGHGVEVAVISPEGREGDADIAVETKIDVYGGPLAREDAKVEVGIEIQCRVPL